MRVKTLLFPDPVESSGAAGEVPSGPITEPIAVPVATAPAIPPAANTVATGPVTEDTLKLKRKLEETEKALKDRESTICQMQDEHQSYRKTVEAGTPIPVRKKPPEVKPFRIGRFV